MANALQHLVMVLYFLKLVLPFFALALSLNQRRTYPSR
jgi:hypothetical protein